MAEQDLDRSEAATPFKLKKAREQGQTARSADFTAAVVFAAAMVFGAWQGWEVALDLLRASRAVFVQLGEAAASGPAAWDAVVRLAIMDAAAALLPWLLVLPAAALAGSWLQTGFVLSLEPLKIDFARISPAAGLKRVLSLRTLFDGLRACVKLGLLVVAGALSLHALLPRFDAVSALAPAGFLRVWIADTAGLGLRLALVLVLVAVLDIVFTRREFGRRMRMSRRELKDEFRNREGDPRIRARLRELRRELLKRSRALRNTRQADVVLTNPTHYAVALRYVHGEMDAPRMVAKGSGQLAAAMREIAWRHRVPVVQNPPLARRLFRHMGIDEAVPPLFHAEVARVIVWVYAMRQQRRASGVPS